LRRSVDAKSLCIMLYTSSMNTFIRQLIPVSPTQIVSFLPSFFLFSVVLWHLTITICTRFFCLKTSAMYLKLSYNVQNGLNHGKLLWFFRQSDLHYGFFSVIGIILRRPLIHCSRKPMTSSRRSRSQYLCCLAADDVCFWKGNPRLFNADGVSFH